MVDEGIRNVFSYALALFSNSGTALGQASVEVDWDPAWQWTRFAAVRKGLSPRQNGPPVVLPLWDPSRRAPFLAGFRISVAVDGAKSVMCDFPNRYFGSLARDASTPLVEAGKLAHGEIFTFIPMAFARQDAPRVRGTCVLDTEDVTPPLDIVERDLSRFTAHAYGGDSNEPDDVPVFLPRPVLARIATLAKHASPAETGGALVGRLHRDPASREVFVCVTAQLPARHTSHSTTRLTFTPESWAELRSALESRGSDEVMLGWWHAHPVASWCAEQHCARAIHEACTDTSDCFSEDDLRLHRTVFPGAHSVALVANDVSAGQMRFSLYGWRSGLIERRGFYVQEEASHASWQHQ